MDERVLARMRKICLALPETTERLSHGEHTFFVRDKKTFAMFDDNHHESGRLAAWCAAPAGAQAAMVEQDPERLCAPPYVGDRCWLGVGPDGRVGWVVVAVTV